MYQGVELGFEPQSLHSRFHAINTVLNCLSVNEYHSVIVFIATGVGERKLAYKVCSESCLCMQSGKSHFLSLNLSLLISKMRKLHWMFL